MKTVRAIGNARVSSSLLHLKSPLSRFGSDRRQRLAGLMPVSMSPAAEGRVDIPTAAPLPYLCMRSHTAHPNRALEFWLLRSPYTGVVNFGVEVLLPALT